LQVLNRPQHTGRFNFTTQFPYYKQVLYKPDFGSKTLGKTVVFDMDMSAGDFLALFYLLKIPVEVINLKVECSLFMMINFGCHNTSLIQVLQGNLNSFKKQQF
jgi:hypothetical protein